MKVSAGSHCCSSDESHTASRWSSCSPEFSCDCPPQPEPVFAFQSHFSLWNMDSLQDDIKATDLSAESLTTLMLSTTDLALSNSGLSVRPAGFMVSNSVSTPRQPSALVDEAATNLCSSLFSSFLLSCSLIPRLLQSSPHCSIASQIFCFASVETFSKKRHSGMSSGPRYHK